VLLYIQYGLSYWKAPDIILKAHDEVGKNLMHKIDLAGVNVPEQNKIVFCVANLSTEIALYKAWLE